MRLYAFLFIATFVFGARAASIPDVIAEESVKKIEVPDSDKTENNSSEQELIDQANTIKDVENKLRVKPTEGIPVAVIVDAQPSVKSGVEIDEVDDIDRPEPDLNNPGLPQRQLHETQNPEYHEAEQETAQNLRKSISDAQILLRQGFQGVGEGIQHLYDNNEQLKSVHQTITSLRDGFTSQINKLNDTIYNYLNPKSSSNVRSTEKETVVNFQKIESGLNTLKNDFNNGVKTLAQGVDVVASLKADNENAENSESTNPEASNAVPTELLFGYLNLIHDTVNRGFQNVTQALTNFVTQAQAHSQPPATVQADTPVSTTAQPGGLFQGLQNLGNFFNGGQGNQGQQGTPAQGPLAAIQTWFNNSQNALTSQNNQGPFGWFQNVTQNFGNLIPRPGATPAPAAQTPSSGTADKPAESNPQPASQTAAVTPAAAPVRKFLQNNIIAQGIADTVQKIQEGSQEGQQKDAEVVKEEEKEIVKTEEAEKIDGAAKGRPYGPGPGDNIDRNVVIEVEGNSGVVSEEQKEKLLDEPKKEAEVKEEKTEQTVNKTE